MPLPATQLRPRLKRIRLLLCDVDGVLTDGAIYITSDGEFKRFQCQRQSISVLENLSDFFVIGCWIRQQSLLDPNIQSVFFRIFHRIKQNLIAIRRETSLTCDGI